MGVTKIEWTNRTWNPIAGCTPVSPGCKNCYAMVMAHRFKGGWGEGLTTEQGNWSGKLDIRPHLLEDPFRWKAPQRVFVCSGSDLFHEDVPFKFIAAVFGVMASNPRHTFQVLTKRPQRAIEFFAWLDDRDRPKHWFCNQAALGHMSGRPVVPSNTWPLPNVWMGVSVEDQERANERIPLLLQLPAAVHWLSCEPLLGPVSLTEWLVPAHRERAAAHAQRTGHQVISSGCGSYCVSCTIDPWSDKSSSHVDWVVVGGESGRGARRMETDWARDLRDQCGNSGVPFLFKQHGAFDVDARRVGKGRAGRVLDGVEHNGYPEAR